MLHLLFLHETGSSNPTGLNSNPDKVPFHAYFSYKDIFGFSILIAGLAVLSTFAPNILGDPDNFTPANPLVTPPTLNQNGIFYLLTLFFDLFLIN
ncbi:hypothetical protein GDO81_027091 [Engystomops pustulosus]|uniref:Cytochrome b n=1 Tax=Engystomops pustulosus TaxID=76066 RepID=A0AAV6Z1M7_ENGPU|nr:hypothetical protein GDO81_027091 [Engystomops pustulosus]